MADKTKAEKLADALEAAAEEAYANLDDSFLSGHGYATSTAAAIRALKVEE